MKSFHGSKCKLTTHYRSGSVSLELVSYDVCISMIGIAHETS